MKQILLMSTVLIVMGCAKMDDGKSFKKSPINKELVVLAIDVSQSFKLPKIESEYLRSMCKTLEKRSKTATIILYPLGNPSHNPNIIKCELKGNSGARKGLTLSQKRKAVLRKKKNMKENEFSIRKFEEEYTNQIYSKKKTAHTDIRSFNKWLSILVEEGHLKGYQKTLFLYSDGVNSIAGRDEFYPLKKHVDGLEIYTCGLAKNSTPFKQSYKELTSYQSFFQTIKN